MVTDDFSHRYGHLLTGSYDCVDRVVLNAYNSLCHSPGGFRVWWRRWHGDSDEQLDNTHLMRMAGRFSRRVRAFANVSGIPVVDCGRGERKHRIAEEYLATHAVGRGLFLILVARAPATVWDVRRSATTGVIGNLAKKQAFVNHYSFHIMDPDWGHLIIKMSGHPPFAAQIICNGHEFVACQAQAAGIGFTKEGNCFTAVADPTALAEIAVLAKCGVQVLMSDLFGLEGTALLDRLDLPEPYAVRIASLRRVMDLVDFEIEVFTGLVGGRLARDPGYTAVQTIPGIGPTLGAVLVAEIGDIGRFARPQQLTCWAGLTPKHHESDTHVHRGRITKQGSRLVRWAVVESVQVLPKTSTVGIIRDRIGARRGRNIGVVAAARRQLEYVFYALRDHHVRALGAHPRPVAA